MNLKFDFNKLKTDCKTWWKDVWINPKSTFYFLFMIMVLLLLGIVISTKVQGGFLHFNTDDILQYYPFMGGFIEKIKSGNLSLYDTTVFGGTSFFATVYYLPIDIFTVITFILSYIMDAETAYALCNYSRVMCGSLLLFYVLYRKQMKNITSFVVSLIYFVGGMTQAYYVFPVYLGINFYVPLAMLIVDLCIEKKKDWYLLLPLYSVVVILYDFYLAYMLLAFLMFYFVAESHKKDEFSFFGKNTIIKNYKFWLSFLKTLGLVVLGVGMALYMLLPSMLYVLNESSRSSGTYESSLWIFQIYNSDAKGYITSWRHYFTLWCNFFIPNEPHTFMLVEAGDYVKEHASFFITSGGAIFLGYFFFINKKEFNRMKLWVVIINALFIMPIASMILTFNSSPYVRWFFIPYAFNIYAAAMAMDDCEFACSKKKWHQIIPLVILGAALTTLLYVLIKDPEIFIHYKKGDLFFYFILIPSIAFIVCYLSVFIINFFINLKEKNISLLKVAIPIMIVCECIFSGIIIYCNIDNTSQSYYINKDKMTEMKENLYDYGYSDDSGYRINIYDNSAKGTTNANTLIGNVNFGRFFHSFYNTPLNTCLADLLGESSTSWSRKYFGGYNLLTSNLFTTKYVVTYTGQNIHFPSYYNQLGSIGEYTYYELTDMPQIIVYDKAFSYINLNLSKKQEAALKYAYVARPATLDIKEAEDEEEIAEINLYQQYLDSGIEMLESNQVTLNGNHKFLTISSSGTERINGSNYFYYEIAGRSVLDNDVLQVYPTNKTLREIDYEDIFIRDTEGHDHGMHYTTAYLEDSWTPQRLYIKTTDTTLSTVMYFFSYSYDAYENFIETQNKYTNKSFILDGSTMRITCDMPAENKTRIIKTPYTYSQDWICKDFDTINVDGGFLGIVIPSDVKKVDTYISYNPKGFAEGCKIALVSSIIYVAIATPTVVTFIRKRKEKDEKNIDNSSML